MLQHCTHLLDYYMLQYSVALITFWPNLEQNKLPFLWMVLFEKHCLFSPSVKEKKCMKKKTRKRGRSRKEQCKEKEEEDIEQKTGGRVDVRFIAEAAIFASKSCGGGDPRRPNIPRPAANLQLLQRRRGPHRHPEVRLGQVRGTVGDDGAETRDLPSGRCELGRPCLVRFLNGGPGASKESKSRLF